MRTRGMGSVFQDKRGLWTGRVELPANPVTGARRRVTLRRKDQAELVRELRKLQNSLAEHGDLPTASTTLTKYMTYWLERVNRSRPRTRAGYRSKIEQYIVPAIGKIRLSQLTPADVRKLETYIIQTKGLSSTSALQAYQILAKALKDAQREGRVTRNVARLVDPPVKAVTNLIVLSGPEATTVLRSIAETRLGSRIANALLTGMRQGEALGMELNRTDFRTNLIDLSWQLQRVSWRHGDNCPIVGVYKEEKSGKEQPLHQCGQKRGTDCLSRKLDASADWEHRHLTGGLYLSRPKSKAGWRQIPMVEPLRSILERRAALAESEPNPHGLMWTSDPKLTKHTREILPLDGSPIDPSRDSAAWHDALEAAGVPDMRLHDARSTAVTLLYDLEIPETVIQDIVGQSAVAATRGYRFKNKAPLFAALEKLSSSLSLGELANLGSAGEGTNRAIPRQLEQ